MLKKFLPIIFIFLLASGLRLWQLGHFPISPYWEEVALGYDASSILKTVHDHHGNFLPTVAFESFGDWKPSLYFYVLVPFLAVFDLSVWAVRLPSALAGIVTVLILYFWLRDLVLAGVFYSTENSNSSIKKYHWVLPFFAAFFLAISPWSVLFSRVAFEANLALFLDVFGGWLFWRGVFKISKNTWKNGLQLILSCVFWGLSLYAYHGSRVFIPLLGFSFGLYFWKNILQVWKWSLLTVVVFGFLAMPIVVKSQSPEVANRFTETSAFTTLDPILASNQEISRHHNALWAKVLHHRYWYYGEIFVNNYLSHFSPKFLFLSGDENGRHAVGLVGQLYVIQLPLIVLGVVGIFAYSQWGLLPFVFWLFLSPVAAALTMATPHALRALPMVIPLCVLSANGIWVLLHGLKKAFEEKFPFVLPQWVGIVVISVVVFVSFFESARFAHYYTHHYVKVSSQVWQYGYEDVVNFVKENQDNYDKVLFTRKFGRPAMYYWFYTKTDPRKVQSWESQTKMDQGEYLSFEKITFGESLSDNTGKILHVSMKTQMPTSAHLLKEVSFLDGSDAWAIWE